ncbi:MAG: response regulator [Polyangiales bacterium]
MSGTLLLVDDDAPFREALASAFTRRGWSTTAAQSPDEALRLAATVRFTHAVIDLRMPGGSGMDLLRDLTAALPGISVVVLTGYGSIPTAIEAIKRGAVNYLTKPAEPAEIEAAFGESELAEPAHVDDATVPSLDRAQWEHLQRVLADCDGNISETARRLGMHRRTLQRKLQKYPPRR